MVRISSSIVSLALASMICSASLRAEYELMPYQPRMVANKEKPKAKPKAKDKKKEKSVADQRVIVTKLRGIVITADNESTLPPDHVVRTAAGVELYRFPSSVRNQERKELKKKLEKKFIGKTLTVEKLNQIKRDVNENFRKNGQALVIVSIPEQDITDNVVVVHVLTSKAGKVEVKGNKWFSEDRYMEYVSLQEDDIVYNGNVEQDVSFINRNPFRHATVTYSPGEAYGTTDITYNVQDERPFRVYAGADDTGFRVTDIFRVFFGFNWGSFLTSDQILCYQYTASPDFKQFQSHTAHYTVPLPNKNLLVFFGGYSIVESAHEIIPANIHKGQALQTSGRYVYPFIPQGNWEQEVKTGIDYKRTNNDLIVGETILSSAYASIFQYMAGYETSYNFGPHSVDGEVELFLQPFAIGASMSKANYAKLRPGADTQYGYIKGGFNYNFLWQKIRTDFHIHSTFQVSSGALLPMEQLGMGGFNSLRAYPERAVNVDYGIIVNLEVRSPMISLFHRKDKKPVDSFGAVGFFDFGLGGLAKKVPNEPGFWGLAGVGPGIRYNYSSYLHTRLDMGIRLPQTPFGSESPSRVRVYFSVVASY